MQRLGTRQIDAGCLLLARDVSMPVLATQRYSGSEFRMDPATDMVKGGKSAYKRHYLIYVD